MKDGREGRIDGYEIEYGEYKWTILLDENKASWMRDSFYSRDFDVISAPEEAINYILEKLNRIDKAVRGR